MKFSFDRFIEVKWTKFCKSLSAINRFFTICELFLYSYFAAAKHVANEVGNWWNSWWGGDAPVKVPEYLNQLDEPVSDEVSDDGKFI